MLAGIKITLAQSKVSGEAVPGARIYIELESATVPIAIVETDEDGEFKFEMPKKMDVPKNGTFSLTITPPQNLKGKQAKKLAGMQKQTIKIAFNRKDGPKFKYLLLWKIESKAQNKGTFAVSGKSTA